MLIMVMQGLKARFILQLACTGSIITVMKDDVPLSKLLYDDGEVLTAKFSYHGPDTYIRSLWLYSRGATRVSCPMPICGSRKLILILSS